MDEGEARVPGSPETADESAVERKSEEQEISEVQANSGQGRGRQFLVLLKKWAKRWFIDAFGGMAQGLFATLIMGLIVKQIGTLIGDNAVGNTLVLAGKVATVLTGAGIGAGIAHALKANRLVIFSAMVAGLIGAQAKTFIAGSLVSGADFVIANVSPGDPIGAYFAAIIGAEIGILITGKTKIDIIALPFCVIVTGVLVAHTICPPVIWLMDVIGAGIEAATRVAPFFMGIIIAVVVGILLTMPTSSAAICISIKLGGIAGAAGAVGCAAHMVGFAVASFKENRWSGLVAQGLGTSMLQIPNVMRKPIIMLPAIAASAVVGPLSTCLFQLQCDPGGSGMGTSGLVGVLSTYQASSAAGVKGWVLWLGIVLLFFVLPGLIAWLVSTLLRKKGLIQYGDMKLEL